MKDQERWDAKYSGGYGERRSQPSDLVVEWAATLAAKGRALDLASGSGRHALHLAQTGWQVSAWDVSPVGLALLGARAKAAELEIETRALDLLLEPAPAETFDLVVCVLFFDRTLFADLARFVAPGGHLVFSTVTEDFPDEKPPMRFRLKRGELALGVPGFELVKSHERDGLAGVLARRLP